VWRLQVSSNESSRIETHQLQLFSCSCSYWSMFLVHRYQERNMLKASAFASDLSSLLQVLLLSLFQIPRSRVPSNWISDLRGFREYCNDVIRNPANGSAHLNFRVPRKYPESNIQY